ncbi:hypothetical protein BJ166DRAFT_533308 [Pestalotiopsis sp. NC0098]|nr:hypothetical protein BJ166DRAFT_533308 [Pestalotiopsis sp. NC0098]
METKGILIWTVFSVIYAWLTPSAVRKRSLSDWEDGARQIKARLFTVLDSDNTIHRQVARIVSSKLFDHDPILRALTKAPAVQPDLGQRESTSGPDLPADPYRPVPMLPRVKARGLTFGRLLEGPELPSLNSTSGSAFPLADGPEAETPEEEAPMPKPFLCPSPPPYSTRESALVQARTADSNSSGEETSIPEPFQYESPQKTSIPRHDLPETIGSKKGLKLSNGYKHTPKFKILLAKPQETQHPQSSSPPITNASNHGYARLDELAAMAIDSILEKDKELKAEKEKAEKEKAEKEKAEKEKASKTKREKPPRIWTEEECEICSCIIYAHQDTTPIPGGGYLCPSCVREDNLVFCAVCDNVFTETPYTHLDQDEQPLCFKCWKEGPQDPDGKVMNDLNDDLLIPNILDLNLEAPYYQPRPTKSQSKGENQDRMDLDDSDAGDGKRKSQSTAQRENNATMDLGDDDDDDDGSSRTSQILRQSERIKVSTDNMIASTIRNYKKFGV